MQSCFHAHVTLSVTLHTGVAMFPLSVSSSILINNLIFNLIKKGMSLSRHRTHKIFSRKFSAAN